jgi:hypothetical protein
LEVETGPSTVEEKPVVNLNQDISPMAMDRTSEEVDKTSEEAD